MLNDPVSLALAAWAIASLRPVIETGKPERVRRVAFWMAVASAVLLMPKFLPLAPAGMWWWVFVVARLLAGVTMALICGLYALESDRSSHRGLKWGWTLEAAAYLGAAFLLSLLCLFDSDGSRTPAWVWSVPWAVTTVSFVVMAFCTFVASRLPMPPMPEVVTVCRACGYSLGDLPDNICPECGSRN